MIKRLTYWPLRLLIVLVFLTWLLSFAVLRLIIDRSRILLAFAQSGQSSKATFTARE